MLTGYTTQLRTYFESLYNELIIFDETYPPHPLIHAKSFPVPNGSKHV